MNLAAGSLVVERYIWTKPDALYAEKRGVQWLAQVVNADGNLQLIKVCKTKAEALAAICEEAAAR